MLGLGPQRRLNRSRRDEEGVGLDVGQWIPYWSLLDRKVVPVGTQEVSRACRDESESPVLSPSDPRFLLRPNGRRRHPIVDKDLGLTRIFKPKRRNLCSVGTYGEY